MKNTTTTEPSKSNKAGSVAKGDTTVIPKTAEEKKAEASEKRAATLAAKKKAEEEKRIVDQRQFQLDSIKKKLVFSSGEPTRSFSVGERVHFGAHSETVVTAVLEGGHIYEIEVRGTERGAYTHQMVEFRRSHFVMWHDILAYKTPEEQDRIPQLTERVQDVVYSQRQVGSLIHDFYHGGVIMNPSYQRDDAWDEADKTALIESIMTGVDIGKFTFVLRPYQKNGRPHHSEILDGKQRLRTIIEFYEGRFKWRGQFYQELHPYDQNFFEGKSAGVAILNENTTELEKCQMFLRLNTTGKPQSPEHLRMVQTMVEMITVAGRKGES